MMCAVDNDRLVRTIFEQIADISAMYGNANDVRLDQRSSSWVHRNRWTLRLDLFRVRFAKSRDKVRVILLQELNVADKFDLRW